MVSREVPLSLLSGLGFKLTDKDKNEWEISERAKTCILEQLKMKGLRDGSITIQKGGKGLGTLYNFTFKTRETPVKDHVYMMHYSGGEVYVDIDPTHIEETKVPSEAGKSTEEAGEARLDKFFLGLIACQKGYVFKAQPKAPRAEPAPVMPAGPAAAGAPPPGWGGEPRAAPPGKFGDLEEMMRNMKLGKEGGRRRTKKQKRARRKATKKNPFR
jgi:hypothetical protein